MTRLKLSGAWLFQAARPVTTYSKRSSVPREKESKSIGL